MAKLLSLGSSFDTTNQDRRIKEIHAHCDSLTSRDIELELANEFATRHHRSRRYAVSTAMAMTEANSSHEAPEQD